MQRESSNNKRKVHKGELLVEIVLRSDGDESDDELGEEVVQEDVVKDSTDFAFVEEKIDGVNDSSDYDKEIH